MMGTRAGLCCSAILLACAPASSLAQPAPADPSKPVRMIVSVPAGTPRAIVTRLNAAAAEAIRNPEIRARLIAIGGDPVENSPQEFAAFLRDGYENTAWRRSRPA